MKTVETLEHAFYISKTLFWIFYILTIIGVWTQAPTYLNFITETMKVIVAFVLIYFFNPWKKTKCTDFHREVVFSSAIFLLFSISFNSLIINVL
jgi:hypothetical protein